MSKVVDMLGARCGRLVVTGRAANTKHGLARWFCRCSCENRTETIVVGSALRNGNTKSCGCLSQEAQKANFIHGHARCNATTEIYKRWAMARHRGKTRLDFLQFLKQQEKES